MSREIVISDVEYNTATPVLAILAGNRVKGSPFSA